MCNNRGPVLDGTSRCYRNTKIIKPEVIPSVCRFVLLKVKRFFELVEVPSQIPLRQTQLAHFFPSWIQNWNRPTLQFRCKSILGNFTAIKPVLQPERDLSLELEPRPALDMDTTTSQLE